MPATADIGANRIPASSDREAVIQPSVRSLIVTALSAALLAAAPQAAEAYLPCNHERSVKQGAERYQAVHAARLNEADLEAIIAGVLEPDDPVPSTVQMLFQRVERDSYGKRRDVAIDRIAAQSFHGSPNIIRAAYGESAEEQRLKRQAIPLPAGELMPDRFGLDVYAYDTNQGVRNRMLINASQFLCVSYAHRDPAQSGRKLGNMLHMVGDTYSASHVQRTAPEGSPDNCGTEKIEWHFSMDLISWKLHRPADKQTRDWRFRCLVHHAADLMKLWSDGRAAVVAETEPAAKLERANVEVAKSLRLLCERVFREDADVLRRPAGGAAAGYSIASGTDKWKFFEWLFRTGPEDRPIQPIGLTGTAEAEAFYKSVDTLLRARGGPPHFWYPPRDMPDLCQALARHDSLPAAVKCSAQEIDWAMRGAKQVETMWIPARTIP